MDVEWVEVRMQLTGPAEDLDGLRIFLTSPDGTQSELNNFYGDPDFADAHIDPAIVGAAGDLLTRSVTSITMGARSSGRSAPCGISGRAPNSVPLVHPVTGEPILDSFGQPIFRNWELHIENWSNSAFTHCRLPK